MGPVERAVGRRHPRHRARSARPRRRCSSPTAPCTVSWSPPANEGSAITAYDLQIGGGASAIQRIGNTTTFRWEGLTNGQEYTFMVRAVNAKGEGQFSSASAPEHPLRPPDAPAAPTGERGDKTINVRWSPPGNGGDPVIEYEVQILSTGAVEPHHRHVAAVGQPAQRPAPAVPGPGPQPRRTGARRRRRRRPSSRAACPTRRAASRPSAPTARRPCHVGRARQPGLRHHRLHDQRPTRASR